VAIQLYTGLRHPAASEMSSVEITGKLMDAMAATAAALATPPPKPPTDEELLALRSWSSHSHTFDSDLVDFALAALERWGR